MNVHAHFMFLVVSPTSGLFAQVWVVDQVELDASYHLPVAVSWTATCTEATAVSSVTRAGRAGPDARARSRRCPGRTASGTGGGQAPPPRATAGLKTVTRSLPASAT